MEIHNVWMRVINKHIFDLNFGQSIVIFAYINLYLTLFRSIYLSLTYLGQSYLGQSYLGQSYSQQENAINVLYQIWIRQNRY